MVAVKVSRETHQPKRDNRTDGAGYFECLDLAREERARREAPGKDETACEIRIHPLPGIPDWEDLRLFAERRDEDADWIARLRSRKAHDQEHGERIPFSHGNPANLTREVI